MRLLTAACIDTREDGTKGWAILVGQTNPPEVVAFCWSREYADEVYRALGGHNRPAGGVWIAPAFLTDDDR